MSQQQNGDDDLRQALAEFRDAVQNFTLQFEDLQPQPLGNAGNKGWFESYAHHTAHHVQYLHDGSAPAPIGEHATKTV